MEKIKELDIIYIIWYKAVDLLEDDGVTKGKKYRKRQVSGCPQYLALTVHGRHNLIGIISNA